MILLFTSDDELVETLFMSKYLVKLAKRFFAITTNTVNFLFFVLKCRFQSEFSSTDDAKTGDKEVLNNS